MRKYIEAGKIINTHGVNGGLKAEPWCDSPSVLKGLGTVYFAPLKSGEEFTAKKIVKASVQGENVLLWLEGISSKEDAEKLKNTVVYADRDDIPKNGGYLVDDLKGLDVIDAISGKVYGKFYDIEEYAGRQVYVIKCGEKEVLLPNVKEFVSRIDLEKGIFITPIKGFFDED